MSSSPIQAPYSEHIEAEIMPLPYSGPDSAASVTGDTASHKSDSTEPGITVSVNDPSIADMAKPEITVSAVDFDDGVYQDFETDELDEAKFMDPHDKSNDGDVIKYFFTSSTRKRPQSPVSSEPGCFNPRLHRDSDLYIKARDKNGQVYVFEVASTILEKASPKFEDMVYSTHVRGNREEWVWELSDNPLGLKIMLCLLHNKFPRAMLATKPKPSQIYTVLRVLDEYEIDLEDTNFHLLAKLWIDAFRKGLPKTKLNNLQVLYVAHKLGDFKIFKETVRKVAHDVAIGEDGSLRYENGRRIQDIVPIKEVLLATIKSIRSEDIEAVLMSLKDPYDYFMDAEKSTGQDYCKSIDGHLECNQKLLGSLLSNLLQQKLFPIPEAKEYKGSFNSLTRKVGNMEIRGLFYPGVEMHKQRHTRCKLGQDDLIESLRGCKGYIPLSDDLVEYMYFMCKRCGMFRDERKEFEEYKDTVRDVNMLYRDEFQKEIWGWVDLNDSDTESDVDDYYEDEDSGFFGTVDNSVWIERKVSLY